MAVKEVVLMNQFIYKKSAGVTALSASIADFTYKKHAHQEYAIGVTLRGINTITLMVVYNYLIQVE